jgi:hypothetical protein
MEGVCNITLMILVEIQPPDLQLQMLGIKSANNDYTVNYGKG